MPQPRTRTVSSLLSCRKPEMKPYRMWSRVAYMYGLTFSFPTIVAKVGFTANAHFHSCPPYIVACGLVYFSSWCSDRYRQRMTLSAVLSAIAFVGILMAAQSVAHKNYIPLSYIGKVFATVPVLVDHGAL